MKVDMTRMNVAMKLQNETIEDKRKAIERWEKKFGESDKKIAKLQKEKEAEVRKVDNIRKDRDDLRDEKKKMEEILMKRLKRLIAQGMRQRWSS